MNCKEKTIMAQVTDLRTITNNTPYAITVRNGENKDQFFTVNGNAGWDGSLWVPWIGNDGESWKAIHIIAGATEDLNIWVFQDYWNPPNKDAVKCFYGSSMNYGGAKEIDGNNRGGGRKALILYLNGPTTVLKML
jgi:hypothetical protein